MKILFINLPFTGHINPTLGLIGELRKKGYKVTYVLTKEWKEKIIKLGANFIEYKDDIKLSNQIKNAYKAAEEIIENFDLIIYEQFFFLGKALGEKYNKPVIRIFTSLASNKKIIKRFLKKGNLWIFNFKFIEKAFTKSIIDELGIKTKPWLEEITENSPELNLVYTIREFQPFSEEFSEKNYKFIGGSIYKRNNESLLISKDKPLIYVSLGTIINNNKRFYKKCIEAFKNDKFNVIISIGSKVKKEDLGEIPNNIYIYPSVTQIEVLKEASIFITHGGLNSVTEAMYYGVPIIVIPNSNDQPLNAERVEKVGIGINLNNKKITPKLLKEKVYEILNNKEILRQCKETKNIMLSIESNKIATEIINEYVKNKII